MKRVMKFLSALLVLALLFSARPAQAHAADTTKLKAGKSIKLSQQQKNYKLTLKKDSLVKVSWSGHKPSSFGYIHCTTNTKNISKDNLLWAINSNDFTKKGTLYFGAAKGSVYLRMLDSKGTTKVKVTITPVSKYNTDNFKRANAKTLTSSTWQTLVQTPNNNYPRWYKIEVPMSKTITITANEGAGRLITLIDFKGEAVPVAKGTKILETEDPVKAGTYFIVVEDHDFENIQAPYGYVRFKWQ